MKRIQRWQMASNAENVSIWLRHHVPILHLSVRSEFQYHVLRLSSHSRNTTRSNSYKTKIISESVVQNFTLDIMAVIGIHFRPVDEKEIENGRRRQIHNCLELQSRSTDILQIIFSKRYRWIMHSPQYTAYQYNIIYGHFTYPIVCWFDY